MSPLWRGFVNTHLFRGGTSDRPPHTFNADTWAAAVGLADGGRMYPFPLIRTAPTCRSAP